MVYYVIRRGRTTDCGDLFRLIKETAEFSGQKSHPGSDDRDLTILTSEEVLRKDAFCSKPLFYFLVVECFFTQDQIERNDGEIIGFSTFNEWYSIYKGKSAYISGMFVSSSHRGNHLAPSLFRTTAKVCLENDCKSLMWGVSRWNFGGKTFYQKLGAVNTTDREQREFMTLHKDNLTKLVREYVPQVPGGVEIHVRDDIYRRDSSDMK